MICVANTTTRKIWTEIRPTTIFACNGGAITKALYRKTYGTEKHFARITLWSDNMADNFKIIYKILSQLEKDMDKPSTKTTQACKNKGDVK